MTTPTTATDRPWTPHTNNPDGSTTLHMKRCCNGCGDELGDVIDRDIDAHGNLTDVRGECPRCAVVAKAEQAGADCRQLTPRTIGELYRWIDNGKPYTVEGEDGKLKVDGLSVYNVEAKTYEDRRHVARFGDWIAHWPDGRWTTIRTESGEDPQR